MHASHAYAAAGPYTITVTASDDDEADGSDSVAITVEAAATSADLSVTQTDKPDPVTAGTPSTTPSRSRMTARMTQPTSRSSIRSPAGRASQRQGMRPARRDSADLRARDPRLRSPSDVSIVVSTHQSPAHGGQRSTVAVTEDDRPGRQPASEATVVPPPANPDASGWITAAGGTVATEAAKPPTKKDPMTTSVTVPPGFPGVVTIAEGPIVACPAASMLRAAGGHHRTHDDRRGPAPLVFLYHPCSLPPERSLTR